MNQAAFPLEPLVEGRAGEGGEKSYLHLVQAGLFHEAKDLVENFGCVAVQSEDEAAVDGDAVGLNPGDGVLVEFLLAKLPIGVQFQPVETNSARALKPDK